MYVRVRKPFTIGDHMHDRGDVVYVIAEIADALPDLLRAGAVVVVAKDDRSPIQLTTPESGQTLTSR